MIEKISSLMDRAFTKTISRDLRRELPDVKVIFGDKLTIYAEICRTI